MMHFIAIDLENFTVDLYTEDSFINEKKAEEIPEIDGYDSADDRLTDLVQMNYCEIAWDRYDAVGIILDQIETLAVDEDDGPELVKLAKMLVTIGENTWWDPILENNR